MKNNNFLLKSLIKLIFREEKKQIKENKNFEASSVAKITEIINKMKIENFFLSVTIKKSIIKFLISKNIEKMNFLNIILALTNSLTNEKRRKKFYSNLLLTNNNMKNEQNEIKEKIENFYNNLDLKKNKKFFKNKKKENLLKEKKLKLNFLFLEKKTISKIKINKFDFLEITKNIINCLKKRNKRILNLLIFLPLINFLLKMKFTEKNIFWILTFLIEEKLENCFFEKEFFFVLSEIISIILYELDLKFFEKVFLKKKEFYKSIIYNILKFFFFIIDDLNLKKLFLIYFIKEGEIAFIRICCILIFELKIFFRNLKNFTFDNLTKFIKDNINFNEFKQKVNNFFLCGSVLKKIIKKLIDDKKTSKIENRNSIIQNEKKDFFIFKKMNFLNNLKTNHFDILIKNEEKMNFSNNSFKSIDFNSLLEKDFYYDFEEENSKKNNLVNENYFFKSFNTIQINKIISPKLQRQNSQKILHDYDKNSFKINKKQYLKKKILFIKEKKSNLLIKRNNKYDNNAIIKEIFFQKSNNLGIYIYKKKKRIKKPILIKNNYFKNVCFSPKKNLENKKKINFSISSQKSNNNFNKKQILEYSSRKIKKEDKELNEFINCFSLLSFEYDKNLRKKS